MAADSTSRRGTKQRLAVLTLQALGLGVLWVVFSGKLDALHLGFGVLSIVLVLIMSHGFLAVPASSGDAAALDGFRPLRALGYLAWLVKEILVANIDIARLVLDPRLPIDPVLVRFRTRLPGRVPKVVLGNSITLTPGTLTLHIVGNELIVHAITQGSATSPVIDEMERRLAAVFGAPPPPSPLVMTLSRALPPARGARPS